MAIKNIALLCICVCVAWWTCAWVSLGLWFPTTRWQNSAPRHPVRGKRCLPLNLGTGGLRGRRWATLSSVFTATPHCSPHPPWKIIFHEPSLWCQKGLGTLGVKLLALKSKELTWTMQEQIVSKLMLFFYILTTSLSVPLFCIFINTWYFQTLKSLSVGEECSSGSLSLALYCLAF